MIQDLRHFYYYTQ